MSNVEANIDVKKVLQMFSEFNEKLRKKTFKTALRKSANILKKQTITNLKASVNHIDRRDKWGNTLRKGVGIAVAKTGYSAKVHLMKNFKLKFFEMGTDDRYQKTFKRKRLKKQRYVGKIKPLWFFKKAKEQTETKVFDSIEQNLINTIKKINEKYK